MPLLSGVARGRLARAFVAVWVVVAAAVVAACGEGCRSTSGVQPNPPAADPSVPTLRLYVVSDVAGALEPCGCVKDQLGGLDHVAAWISAEKKGAPSALLLASGPLFFLDPKLDADKKEQDLAKAETLAASLKTLGLGAFAPGQNDLAAGRDELVRLVQRAGAPALAANAEGYDRATVREIGGVKVGLVGVSALDGARAPADAVKDAAFALKQQGAKVVVALAAVGRGEAKRIADAVPDLTAIVVGSPSSSGEANTTAPAPERIGSVLVVEASNHLQTVGVLDLFVRDGAYAFADGTGLEKGAKREALTRRITELRGRIATWEREGKVDKKDIDARKADVAKLEAEREALDREAAPPKGSYFRYTSKEIREALGSSPDTHAQLLGYYKKVNDRNKELFKDRKPREAAKGEAKYVGVDACTSCHEEPRKVWDKTPHAQAYATLQKQFKEFNLDCVSCHVTGYDKPGGSTVTHVQGLESVQCETCHGPGSAHAKAPEKVKPPVSKPEGALCERCHHPPHVHEFDAKAKMKDVLGPGHGMK
jgi:hypothetical protein